MLPSWIFRFRRKRHFQPSCAPCQSDDTIDDDAAPTQALTFSTQSCVIGVDFARQLDRLTVKSTDARPAAGKWRLYSTGIPSRLDRGPRERDYIPLPWGRSAMRQARSVRTRSRSFDPLEPRSLLSTLIALVDSGVDLASTTDSPYYDFNGRLRRLQPADGRRLWRPGGPGHQPPARPRRHGGRFHRPGDPADRVAAGCSRRGCEDPADPGHVQRTEHRQQRRGPGRFLGRRSRCGGDQPERELLC